MAIFLKSRQTVAKVLAASVMLSLAQLSHASLVNRGGGLIYDTVLDVTWLQDANYALTSGYATSGSNGQMQWSEAMTWADSLSYYDSVRNVTWTDWRLPTVSPLNGATWYWSTSISGDSDSSYNISVPGTPYAGSTASELAYMYFINLGNEARCPITSWAECKDSLNTARDPALKTGPFENLDLDMYWTNIDEGVPNPGLTGDAITFDYDGGQYGFQGAFHKIVPHGAWAVRSGDVGAFETVSEPSSGLLVALGLAGFILGKRRSIRVLQ